MKLSSLQQNCNTRRTNSFRAGAGLGLEPTVDGVFKSPAALFWLILHGLCCLISLILGFRFSRLILFLFVSTSSTTSNTVSNLYSNTLTHTLTFQSPPLPPISHLDRPNRTASRVVVGRHGIRIRPWPHPNPAEVMKAHRLIERVQREQRAQFGVKNPRSLIVITPTYVRTFQTLHLTGLSHTLMLVPYDLTWIVVEAGGPTNETASLLAKAGLRTIHLPFDELMPVSWQDRHKMEARMRIRALRVVREKKMDGVVMFADDSNMHSMELFDEIQSVKWVGAVSVGILAHSSNADSTLSSLQEKEIFPVPVQGPACNSSGQLAGWHTFNSLPYVGKSATYIGDGASVLPRKLEWAGFVFNSRLVWQDASDKPEWALDLDNLAEDGGGVESPLGLLKDASFVEPLGKCGRKILLWWFRVEARADSKFPPRWIIDSPLEITVPAKRTPWPDAPPELQSSEKIIRVLEDHQQKPHPRKRSSRSRQSSRKKKQESHVMDPLVTGKHAEEQ